MLSHGIIILIMTKKKKRETKITSLTILVRFQHQLANHISGKNAKILHAQKKEQMFLLHENIHNAINFPSALPGMPRSPHSNIC